MCSEVLANESLKPTKLFRHLNSKHPEYKNKDVSFFERRAARLKTQKSTFNEYLNVSSKAQSASLEVSYLIAQSMKPYNIGESLILPAAIKMCTIMHGNKYGEDLKQVPLSRDTVKRRITDIADDIKVQLLMQIKQSKKFAIQLDESTDVANFAQVIVFIRYCYENDIMEDMLFCKPLEGHATGEGIYKLVDEYFILNNISWLNCIGVCTDGAASMTGFKKGFKGMVLKIAPHVNFTHCVIHREALASKQLEPTIHQVLCNVVKIVNFIKSRPLQSRLFSILCNEMGSEYDNLLLHTEVRWLSRGKILRRFVDLKDEIQLFLMEHNETLAEHFNNENWMLIVCYLTDIFEKLNDLNVSLQGKANNIFMTENKISSFMQKLILWKQMNKEGGSYEMFPCLDNFISGTKFDDKKLKKVILTHLTSLYYHFSSRFQFSFLKDFEWIRSPFDCDIIKTNLTIIEKENLIELSNDSTLKSIFKQRALPNFWLSVKSEYPALASKAMDILLPFASTYLCEVTFSKLTTIKTKLRSRLTDVESELRVAISPIRPRLDEIASKKQAHKSH